jgi:hypothetical protein
MQTVIPESKTVKQIEKHEIATAIHARTPPLKEMLKETEEIVVIVLLAVRLWPKRKALTIGTSPPVSMKVAIIIGGWSSAGTKYINIFVYSHIIDNESTHGKKPPSSSDDEVDIKNENSGKFGSLVPCLFKMP